MKKITTIIFFVTYLFNANGQENQVTVELQGFKEIRAFDGISVNLIKSDINRAVISGENSRKVAIVNKSGILKVRMKINKIFNGYRTFVDLYYTDGLKIIDVNEDARIVSEETIAQDVLELRAQEGGEIEINCETEQLLVKAVSGGDVITKGGSGNQDVIINTGGGYDGKEFKTEFTTVKVNAGGNAAVYASDYVKADVKAGGKVLVYGNPSKMDEKTVFGGKIERVQQ